MTSSTNGRLPATARILGCTIFGALLACSLTSTAVASDDFAAKPIAEAELSTQRGREGTTLVEIVSSASHQAGGVSDSVAIGNTNGGNVIRDAAFSNVRGHATVIQNSGNNNVIQDSTIYNFSIRP